MLSHRLITSSCKGAVCSTWVDVMFWYEIILSGYLCSVLFHGLKAVEMYFFWKSRLTDIAFPLLSLLCSWMQFNDLISQHILCDIFFVSSNFSGPITSDLSYYITAFSCSRNTANCQPSIGVRHGQGRDSTQIKSKRAFLSRFHWEQ